MRKQEILSGQSKWYQNLAEIAVLPPRRRYKALYQLHQSTIARYVDAVGSVTGEEAGQVGSDGRTKAIVVAHIMAWEEWQLQIFGDKNREERVKEQMKLKRFYDSERREYIDFTGVNDFNAYQENKYTPWTWQDIQQKALSTAKDLQAFFPENPSNDWVDFLNSTQEHNWQLTPDITITTPAGWYLWMVSLEHEAVEHAADLY